MSRISCTRKIEFDAGHRVIGHENKCKYLHGHRYVLEVQAESEELNELGFVVDFGEIKSLVKGWIDEYFDHNVILHEEDRALGEEIAKATNQTPYYLPNNPSAENIATYLMDKIMPKLFAGKPFWITKLKLYETPNCFVEVVK
ncbi:MAG: 6-carboxytetrahydropterin synthase [Pseudomonadota bacterium]